jgi:hypothetical protein
MADFKYKMDWVPEAKKLREQVSQSGRESMGIASKPKDEQPAMDQDFYESMYGAILQYFDKAEDADKVLSSKKPDRDRIREMTLGEFDELTLRSSEEAALQRMESRTKQSLVEGGNEAFRTKLPEGESLRPVLRDDSTKAEQESTPVTVETETEVPTGGLMSPRLDGKEGDLAESYDSTIVNSFVDMMGELEGTEDHNAQEGQFTYAYGILPATAESLGVDPDDYDTRKEFATAVYGKMRDNAKESYPDVFGGMSGEDQKSVLSLYINLGRLPTGVVDALSGDNKDFNAAGDSLLNVIHYTDKNTKKKYSSKGLSKRRAAEWNRLMQGRDGFTRVTHVDVTGSKANPTFRWLDENNNVVREYTSSKALSPSNSMRRVSVE